MSGEIAHDLFAILRPAADPERVKQSGAFGGVKRRQRKRAKRAAKIESESRARTSTRPVNLSSSVVSWTKRAGPKPSGWGFDVTTMTGRVVRESSSVCSAA